jgi:hypothetical protein
MDHWCLLGQSLSRGIFEAQCFSVIPVNQLNERSIVRMTTSLITSGGTIGWSNRDQRMLSGNELACSANLTFDAVRDLLQPRPLRGPGTGLENPTTINFKGTLESLRCNIAE